MVGALGVEADPDDEGDRVRERRKVNSLLNGVVRPGSTVAANLRRLGDLDVDDFVKKGIRA